MKVWRICNARHAATAFTGEGSRRSSARWNPAGVAMVYTATSLALAAMEVFVHLEGQDTPDGWVSIEAELPMDMVSCERINVSKLPMDWRRERHQKLMLMGAEWFQSKRSLALLVPSAVVVGDWNVLVNPTHSDAGKIAISKPIPFLFDERLFMKK